jgi:iron complex outermembrane recepter protein
MNRSPLPGLALTVSFATVVGAPGGAHAEDNDSPPAATAPQSPAGQQAPGSLEAPLSLQEIVVTAERRATRLQDTPVSVDAITSEQIDSQGLRGIDDITRLAPGVTFTRTGMTATGNFNDEGSDIAIRGIESTAGTSTTGIYLDDIPIQTRHLSFGTVNPFPELFDLDRVEILRGPQGTLFGAGSEGGTVRFIQTQPGLSTYSGYVRSEVATTKYGAPSYEMSAAGGGPLIADTLGFRLSASVRYDGGYVDRVNYDPVTLQPTGTVDSNSNWQRTVAVRGALKFAPTDTLTITPSINYQALSINDTGAYWALLSNPVAGVLNNGNVQPDSSYDPFVLSSLKVDWRLGSLALTSDTSYFSRDQHASSDYTQILREIFLGTFVPQPGDRGTASFTDKQNNLTEEIRLQSTSDSAPLTWVTGLFFAHLHENTKESIADPTLSAEVGGFTDPPPFPGGVIYEQDPFLAIDRQIAVYGQADYKFTPEWKLTAGLRVASVYTSGEEYYAGPFVGPEPGTGSGSFTEHPVTPKFGASYQPDAHDLYYASISKGYRVGGINANLGTLCASSLSQLGLSSDPSRYDSDSLWSYEIGAKNTLLDGRLQIDSSLFYINWHNIQQNVILLSCGLEFTANLGAAVSKGLDLDLQYRAAPGLLLGLQAGYTRARYTKTVYAGEPGEGSPVVTQGDVLAPVPWKLTLAAEYDFPAWRDRSPYLRLDDQFSGAQNGLTPIQDPNNGTADPTLPSLASTNDLSLRTGLRWSGFDVSLFANNVLNSLPALVTARDTTYTSLYYQHTWRPRTIGLTGTYRF